MHSHWNSQPLGNYDQDLNIGVLGYDQMLATLLVFKMHSFKGYYGIDINPERMPVERALVLSMNSLDAATDVINGLDYDTLVAAMFDPAGYPGTVEDVMTRALAPDKSKLRELP